jgi:hypothetical protein
MTRHLKVVKVAFVLVETSLAELADLRVEEHAIGVLAFGEEFADRRVGGDADGLVVGDGDD